MAKYSEEFKLSVIEYYLKKHVCFRIVALICVS